ncbi:hypothetical protein BH10BAC2_BH10BAC2_05000 [soil metagenome]
MKKKLLFVFFMFAAFAAAHAQVRDSRTTIDTTVHSAVMIDTDLSGSEAENAIESYFDSLHITKEKGKGFIIKKSLGYMLFRRAKVENVNDALDIYFVVENRKQKGKDGATVYVAASKNGNFFSESDKDAWGQMREYAAYMQSNYFEQYKLYTQLAAVNKDMDKKKTKLDELLKEKYELETNISTDSSQVVNINEQLLKLKTKKQ